LVNSGLVQDLHRDTAFIVGSDQGSMILWTRRVFVDDGTDNGLIWQIPMDRVRFGPSVSLVELDSARAPGQFEELL